MNVRRKETHKAQTTLLNAFCCFFFFFHKEIKTDLKALSRFVSVTSRAIHLCFPQYFNISWHQMLQRKTEAAELPAVGWDGVFRMYSSSGFGFKWLWVGAHRAASPRHQRDFLKQFLQNIPEGAALPRQGWRG